MNLFISIILILLTIFITALPLLFPIKKGSKITTYGKLFLAAISLGIIFGVMDKIYERDNNLKNESKISSLVSNVDSLKNQIIYQKESDEKDYNDLKNKIIYLEALNNINTGRIIDSTKNKLIRRPLLSLCPLIWNKQNPYTTPNNNSDTVYCYISICNDGNSPAANLKDNMIFIQIFNNGNVLSRNISFNLNRTIIITPNQPGSIFNYHLFNIKSLQYSAIYLYFKLMYTDIYGKQKFFLHKIFKYDHKKMVEVPEDEYNKIRKYLIGKKEW